MNSVGDYGLANALDIISRTLYGAQGVPNSPTGELASAHRQMIATQYPHLVVALLHAQNDRFREVG